MFSCFLEMGKEFGRTIKLPMHWLQSFHHFLPLHLKILHSHIQMRRDTEEQVSYSSITQLSSPPLPPLSLALTRRKLQRFRLSLSERNLGAKLWDGLFILLFLSRQMSQERRRNKKVSKSKGGEEGKLKSVEFSWKERHRWTHWLSSRAVMRKQRKGKNSN